MQYAKRIDERLPKEILNEELYLTAPMVRRLLNCGYNYAMDFITTGREIEKEKNLFIIEEQTKKLRTETFKEMLKKGTVIKKRNRKEG